MVLSLTDCLAYGPISGNNFEKRIDWLDAQIPLTGGWDWIADSVEDFLHQISSWTGDRLVWIAPRSACEQCGLQWYFEQTEVTPGPMIIADQQVQFKRAASVPLGLGELGDEYIADLLDHAPRREWPAELASPREWRRLRAEDTLLRIVENGRLRSVSPTFFDDLLLNRCTAEWQKWSRVVGWSMLDAMEAGHHVGDIFLLWRLHELIGEARIGCRGEFPDGEYRPDRPTAELRRIA